VAGPGQRQAAGWGSYRGKFHTLTPGAGLPDGTVQDILQDRDGYLWFATLNGATRYDGQEFISYFHSDGLCGNGVGSLAQDRDGVIWFGCGRRLSPRGGLTRYDGETFTTYTIGDGLAQAYVWNLQPAQDGGLWILSHSAISDEQDLVPTLQKLAGNRLQTHDVGTPIFALVESSDGSLWLGGDDVVMRLEGETVRPVPSAVYCFRCPSQPSSHMAHRGSPPPSR
jgi:ligand-binding sensor domain-containing protein